MLKINKVEEPDFLKSYKSKYKPKNWDDYNEDNIKFDLKTYILEKEQNINNTNLCVYCEREIDIENNDGHIEHVRPKDKFPQLFQEYSNLSISCNSKNSCGHTKANKYDNKFINPLEENPNDFLTYDDLTGKIIAKDSNVKDMVDYTIEEILKLNEYNLCKARKIILIELHKAKEFGYFDSIKETFNKFPTLIDFYEKSR